MAKTNKSASMKADHDENTFMGKCLRCLVRGRRTMARLVRDGNRTITHCPICGTHVYGTFES